MCLQKLWFWLLAICSLAMVLPVSAQRKLYVDREESATYTDLNYYLELYEDTSRDLTFGGLMSKIEKYSFVCYDSLPRPPRSGRVYWLRFSCVNISGIDDYWIFRIGRAACIDVYSSNSSWVHERLRTGYRRPFSEQNMQKGISTGNKVKLFLPASNDLQTIYFRVESPEGEPLYLNTSLELYEHWTETILHRNLTQGLFQGFLWIMILFHFLMFIASRDKSYLYYSLYMLSLAIAFMIAFGFMKRLSVGNFYFLIGYIVLISNNSITWFYFQFMRHFLLKSGNFPRLDNWLLQWLKIKPGAIGVLLVYYFFTSNYNLSIQLTNFIIFAEIIGNAFILAYLARHINRPALFFVSGTVVLYACGLLTILGLLNIVDYAFASQYFLEIGVFLEILLFAIGIGYKSRKAEKEQQIASQKLIEQYRRNEELQEKSVRELERLVTERTHKLFKQKQALEEHQQRLEKEVAERTEDYKLAKERAEESDRLKTAFLANMSHEIRTPLNAIVGFSGFLSKKNLSPEKRKQYLNLLNSSSEALLNLINDILDLSKIETGQLKVVQTVFSVNQLLENLYETFDNQRFIPLNQPSDVELQIAPHCRNESIYIETDYVRLKQVLFHLLSNAIKFTGKGHVKFGYLNYDNDGMTFFVEDTGIGIAEENFSMIFGRFKKVESDVSQLYRGAGLGLTIVDKLVEMLGGIVWLESVVGKGSTFYFSISCRQITDKALIEKAKKQFFHK